LLPKVQYTGGRRRELKKYKITTIELESLQPLHLNLIYIEEVHKYKGTTIYKLQKQRDIKSSRDKQALEEDGSVMHLTAQTDNASLSTLLKRQDDENGKRNKK